VKSGDKPAAEHFVFPKIPELTLHAIDFIEE
jgi:hypothetical protein